MDDNKQTPSGQKNEGEGSRTADKQYRDAASEFAQRTDTLQAGKKAQQEIEQAKGEFKQAEAAGKSHSAGDLASDLQGKK